MKTKEEMLDDYGCPEIPFDENVTMFYPAILSAMQEYAESYHREQLSAGIKANVLKQKDTGLFYTLHKGEFIALEIPSCYHENGLFLHKLPPDAELVSIIILEEKP